MRLLLSLSKIFPRKTKMLKNKIKIERLSPFDLGQPLQLWRDTKGHAMA